MSPSYLLLTSPMINRFLFLAKELAPREKQPEPAEQQQGALNRKKEKVFLYCAKSNLLLQNQRRNRSSQSLKVSLSPSIPPSLTIFSLHDPTPQLHFLPFFFLPFFFCFVFFFFINLFLCVAGAMETVPLKIRSLACGPHFC